MMPRSWLLLVAIASALAIGCGDTPLPSERLDVGQGQDVGLSFDDMGGDDASVDQQLADAATDSPATGDGSSQQEAAVDGDACGGCGTGLDCVAGSCRCIEGGSCSGCCADATTCISSVTITQCGSAGSACFECPEDRASICIASSGGHCACSGPTFPGPGLPAICDVSMRCDTSGLTPICVPL